MASSARPRGDCWPTPHQEDLLRAALLDGDPARAAWFAYRPTFDLDHLDNGSRRLLPLLYRNLLALGVDDSLLGRLRGVHRYHWLRNQLQLQYLGTLLRSLDGAGVPVLVLKGAALALLNYAEVALRPMDDVDVLVPSSAVPTVLRALRELGWHTSWRSVEQLVPVKHSVPFERADGASLDLHWHVLLECLHTEDDEPFWSGAVPLNINGVLTRTPNPTDHLLHTCVHGVLYNPVPPLRWVADAFVLLQTASIDWERLVRHAAERRLVLVLHNALHYLVSVLDAPVPSEVLRALAAQPSSLVERVEYAGKVHRSVVWAPFVRSWCAHQRLTQGRSPYWQMADYPRYVQQFWGLAHWWQVPSFALAMCLRRVQQTSCISVPS